MSGETVTRSRLSLPSWGQVGFVAGVLFWAWLVVRWLALWVGYTEPFFPAGPFERAAEGLTVDAEVIGGTTGALARPADIAAGLLSWCGDVAGFVAIGVTSLPDLAAGAWVTVVLTVAGILLGLPIAIALSVARIYGGRLTRALSLGYIELIRGTPLLAQLFVVYYGLNLSQYFRDLTVGVLPSAAVWVAIVGFTVNSAAYQAEYIRAAVESVDEGQLTAARSIGLSRLDGIRYVVLPQGLRYAIPGWTNELVYLIKYSSLATFITVVELFTEGEAIANATFRYQDVYILLGLFYLALVLSATVFMDRVERAVAIPGLGVDEGR
ncbi:amino acid ABC transporter permease [Halomarina ordinaria]|uniref:Amino acid ABC transporter permease n=1 Tax=Halomarina ordinaria TaxID=3033939 RepID=A0ABD5UEI3_9EURY|nr:amino acid ABC transporter permease [Halomarina sp. PSRA2]